MLVCRRAGRASPRKLAAPTGEMMLAPRLNVDGGSPNGSEVLDGATSVHFELPAAPSWATIKLGEVVRQSSTSTAVVVTNLAAGIFFDPVTT